MVGDEDKGTPNFLFPIRFDPMGKYFCRGDGIVEDLVFLAVIGSKETQASNASMTAGGVG